MRGGSTPLVWALALVLASASAHAADGGTTPAPAPTRAPTLPAAPALAPTPTPPTAPASAAAPKAESDEPKKIPSDKAGEKTPVAAPKPAPSPAAVKQASVAKPTAPKKGGKPAPLKTSRTTRVPDASARRQVAGGPTGEDALAGAESPELAALREAERELFPMSQPTSDPFAREGSSGEAGRPRVHATGLPKVATRKAPAAEGGKDLSWMAGLVLPELPIRWEPRLVRYLEFFKDDPRGRATISLWLRRSGRYVDSLRKTLRKKGVPEDLVWLSMIESGFDPSIRSPAGAVGLWQFMDQTGRQYGLHQDRWLDQRMNVQNATEAAAEFLGDLHKRFGSWELAMAAYNMGYGGLLLVVRKYNSNDYWALSELEGAIPWETTLYVPKILAAAIVAKNAAKFGFGELAIEPALEFEEVFVPPATPLSAVAKAGGLAAKDVESLNPELRAGRTPPLGDEDPKSTTFAVKVPPGKTQAILANLPKVKRDEKPLERYVVKFGESLETIATARATTTSKLAELNAIAPGELVRGGTVLLVPRAEGFRGGTSPALNGAVADASGTGSKDASVDASGKPVVVVPPDLFVYPDKKRVFYRVTAGDSLRDVSTAFGVSVDEIRRWNSLDAQGRLHEGMTLQLFVPTDSDLSKVVSLSEQDVRTVVVGSEDFFSYFEAQKGRKRIVLAARAGDTLESIGKRYGLSVGSMERINRRGRGDTLREGDRVIVYANDNATSATAGANAKSAPLVEAPPSSCALPGASGPEPLGPLPTAPAPDRLPRTR